MNSGVPALGRMHFSQLYVYFKILRKNPKTVVSISIWEILSSFLIEITIFVYHFLFIKTIFVSARALNRASTGICLIQNYRKFSEVFINAVIQIANCFNLTCYKIYKFFSITKFKN